MKEAIATLKKYQTQSISHSTRTLFDHPIGTGQILQEWDCDLNLCLAGYFHSFYGTEGTGKKRILDFSEREKIQQEIGREAEIIVYLYCVFRRKFYYRCNGDYIWDRLTNQKRSVTKEIFRQLVILDIANLVEEFPRWKYLFGCGFLVARRRTICAMPYLPEVAHEKVKTLFKISHR
ncbi:MAG: hypothetical protein F6K45_03890 [Kamptonema sp. SIO1D9]|nr:hypothetical protein [Kamptonema sp. SIO1D9]